MIAYDYVETSNKITFFPYLQLYRSQ